MAGILVEKHLKPSFFNIVLYACSCKPFISSNYVTSFCMDQF